MNDQNKPKVDAPKNTMGGTAVKPSAWKKLMSKKWAAPAAFMAAAAIIVTLMWLYRGADDSSTKPVSSAVDASQGQGTTDETLDDYSRVMTQSQLFLPTRPCNGQPTTAN